MKKIKAVVLVLIMILCGAAFARGMQVEAKANAVQEKLSGEVFRFFANTFDAADRVCCLHCDFLSIRYSILLRIWNVHFLHISLSN